MFYVGKKESAVVLLKLLSRAMPPAYVNIIGEGVCAILLSPFLRLCAAFFHNCYLLTW